MAIIYSYPNLPLSELNSVDTFTINATNTNGEIITNTVSLSNLATYITNTGTGSGTTNKIVKFTDGANGLLGDSIMTESTDLIDLAGQFVSTSSPTLTQGAPVSGIKATLNGTTAAPNVALYGESKNTGGIQANSNYGLYAKGEFEGTAGFTGFIIGGNLEARYDGSGTNGANATMYGSFSLARATSAANGTISYMIGADNVAKIEGANVTANNLQGAHTGVSLTDGTAGNVIVQILDFDGTGGTVTGDLSYLQIQNDTMPTVSGTSRAINSLSVLPSLFTGQVEIPLVPTINAHATSKQYVDQQISSVVSGLVFQSTWDARTQAEGGLAGDAGNPDLSDASKKVVGHYYVVSTAGSATPNGAGTEPSSWNVGDWCIYVEQGATDRWEKLDQTFVSGAGTAGQVTFWNSQNEVAGDNNFFWDNTNKRLGIGTTVPEYSLDVSNSARINSLSSNSVQLIIDNSNTVDAGTETSEIRFRHYRSYVPGINDAGSVIVGKEEKWDASGDRNSYMSFGTRKGTEGVTEKIRIDSSGNVGIGTDSPDVKLHVDGGANSEVLKIEADSDPFIRWVEGGTDVGFLQFKGDEAFLSNQGNGTFFFRTNNSNRMVITGGGNVGVGTSSPTVKLDVNSGTTNSVARFESTDSVARIILKDNSGEAYLSASGDDMVFSTSSSGSERMRITSAGNVGIGLSNPGYKLEVAEDTNSTADLLMLKNSDATYSQSWGFQSDTNKDLVITGSSGSGGIKFVTGSRGATFTGSVVIDDGVGRMTLSSTSGENRIQSTTTGFGAYEKLAFTADDYEFKLGNATFAGKVNVAGSTNNESALNVLTQSGSIGSIGFETGSEITGIISSNTELMEFRVGDGIGMSSPKQLKIDDNGIEVTGDVEVTNSSDGLILKSPNGTKYRVTVSNGGTLSVSAV
ncbi:MAG: hypothetical protein GY928_38675 [Colwellia sp.]|nr:hypothetical protein [Colwellia sp.]